MLRGLNEILYGILLEQSLGNSVKPDESIHDCYYRWWNQRSQGPEFPCEAQAHPHPHPPQMQNPSSHSAMKHFHHSHAPSQSLTPLALAGQSLKSLEAAVDLSAILLPKRRTPGGRNGGYASHGERLKQSSKTSLGLWGAEHDWYDAHVIAVHYLDSTEQWRSSAWRSGRRPWSSSEVVHVLSTPLASCSTPEPAPEPTSSLRHALSLARPRDPPSVLLRP